MVALKKILVAIDRSPQAMVVLEQALELAQKEESQLLLFHSLSWDAQADWTPFIGTLADMDLYGTFHHIQQQHLKEELETVQSWLQSCCQQAQSQNIPSKFKCKIGDPGLRICEVAQNWDADLIILGRRGHRGLSEIVLGSVSNYVVHHAPCSVLVVQGVTLQNADISAASTQVKS
jgi:nucleotide-binding universal stress UspA family protein